MKTGSMKKLYYFVAVNIKTLFGILAGVIIGYTHWYYWGCYWGTYPLSSECWMHCITGLLFGGFIGSLLQSKN